LIAVNEGETEWASEFLPQVDSIEFTPFTDPVELSIAMKMLNLLMRQEGLSINAITRFNILCLGDLIKCFDMIKAIRPYVNKTILITNINVFNENAVNGIIDYMKLVSVDRLLLYHNNFINLYNKRELLKRLSTVQDVSLLSNYVNIAEDLEFIMALSKLMPNINFGMLIKNPHELFKLSRDKCLNAKFLCRKKWLIYDIIPAFSPELSTPLYMLLPNTKSKVFAILKSGLKFIDSTGIQLINIRDLKKYMLNNKYMDSSFFSRISLFIGLRFNNGAILSDEDLLILKYVDEYKCLKKVARALGMSYTMVRRKIIDLEKSLGVKLIISKRGGLERGLTELSPIGKELLLTLSPIVGKVKNVINKQGLTRIINIDNYVRRNDFV